MFQGLKEVERACSHIISLRGLPLPQANSFPLVSISWVMEADPFHLESISQALTTS